MEFLKANEGQKVLEVYEFSFFFFFMTISPREFLIFVELYCIKCVDNIVGNYIEKSVYP